MDDETLGLKVVVVLIGASLILFFIIREVISSVELGYVTESLQAILFGVALIAGKLLLCVAGDPGDGNDDD